jgi:predicted esterase YcpF (UPF0227 family)
MLLESKRMKIEGLGVLVGNSCGSFYAQMISPIVGIPALLGNPHFKMSDFLRERIGSVLGQ